MNKKTKINISRLLRNGELKNAIILSEKALLSLDLKSEESKIDAIVINSHLGVAYTKLGEFEKGLICHNKSLTQFNNLSEKIPDDEAAIYNNIATCYSGKMKSIAFKYIDKEDIKLSVYYYKKSLEIYHKLYGENDKVIADLYNNLGLSYIRSRKFSDSENYLLMSLNIYKRLFGSTSFPNTNPLLNLGTLYRDVKKYRKAAAFTLKSLKIIFRNKSLVHLKLRISNLLAEIYIKWGKHSVAERYSNLSISSYFKYSKGVVSKPGNTDSDLVLAEALSFRCDIFRHKYEQHNRKQYLLKSYLTHLEIIKILENIRLQYFYEDSKNILNIKAVSFYEKAIETILELHNLTGEHKYLDEAYRVLQKSKSLSMLESMNEVQAKITAGLPPSILKVENKLKKNIGKYEKLVYEGMKENLLSGSKIQEYKDKLYSLKQKFEEYVNQLERSYPEYFNLKYSMKTVTTGDVKKNIPADTTVIEYFLGDSNIFSFVFTDRSCSVIKTKKPVNFDARLASYRNFLTDVNSNLDMESAAKFKKLSYYLYKILLKKIVREEIDAGKEDITGPVKNILIIPDNELSFIPFETLITDYNESASNYKLLPFLIKFFNIIYSYSIIVYLRNLSAANSFKGLNTLAFAPEFKSHSKTTLPSENFRDSLSPLSFNQKEIKEISKLVKGKFYFRSKAVKEKLLQNRGDFSILHLATHSVTDDKNPMYSKIVFSKSGKKNDDGFLHAYEIYSRAAGYNLVVLSACNTGFGKMIRGEGVMSIARAFASTGSRNIVMTLWQVNDKSTSEIMKTFYVNLSQGQPVGEALRQAKLKYIKNSDGLKALPFYGSPFISFGVNVSFN